MLNFIKLSVLLLSIDTLNGLFEYFDQQFKRLNVLLIIKQNIEIPSISLKYLLPNDRNTLCALLTSYTLT